jgi:hypothetical protein
MRYVMWGIDSAVKYTTIKREIKQMKNKTFWDKAPCSVASLAVRTSDTSVCLNTVRYPRSVIFIFVAMRTWSLTKRIRTPFE